MKKHLIILLICLACSSLAQGQMSSLKFVYFKPSKTTADFSHASLQLTEKKHQDLIYSLAENKKVAAVGKLDSEFILVFNSKSESKIENLFTEDPALQIGQFEMVISPMLVDFGGIARGAADKNEYWVISYLYDGTNKPKRSSNRKFKRYMRPLKKKKGGLLFSGGFDTRPETLWIMNHENEAEVINIAENNPILTRPGYSYSIKRLYLMSGKFFVPEKY